MAISIPILQMRKLRLWGHEELPEGSTSTNCEDGTGKQEKTSQSSFCFIGRNPSQTNLGWKKKYWFRSIQLLSHIWLFETPWTAARQASLSIINSQSLLKPMSIESVMPSNHLILCRPLLLDLQSFPALGSFQWVSSLHQVAKVLEFQLQHQSFQWIFRTDFL